MFGIVAKRLGDSSTARRRTRFARHGQRLWLEPLEDRTMLSVTLFGIPNWDAAGPAPELNSGDENVPAELATALLGQNPVSGAIEAIAVQPNSNVTYIGSVNGGVWKTYDISAPQVFWVPLTDQFPGLQIASLQFDPTDGTNQTLVAGIGTTNSLGPNMGPLTGLLKTTDGGKTWIQLGNVSQQMEGLQGLNANSVVPRGDTILVGTPQGVYRSTDAGGTFHNISGLNRLSTGLSPGGVFDLVGDPSNSDRVYVAIGGASAGVFRSDDLGNHWTDLTDTAIGPTILARLAGNMKLSVSAAAPNPVYWAIEGQVGLTGQGVIGLFRSDNQGGQWAPMDVPETLDAPRTITAAAGTPIVITTNEKLGYREGDPVRISGVTGNTAANGDFTIHILNDNQFQISGASSGDYTGGGQVQDIQGINHGGQGGNFTLLADPGNPNLVYVAGDAQGFTGGDSSIGAQGPSARIFRGDFSVPPDGAVPSPQWAPLTNNGTNNNSSPHADSRAMAFFGAQLLYSGDGGIFAETGPQNAAGQWVSKNGDIQVTQWTFAAYDSVSHIILGPTQDTGTPAQLGPSLPFYTDITGGDGYELAVDDLTFAVQSQSIRYINSLDRTNYERTVYDSSNQPVGAVRIPLIPAGGIDGFKSFNFLTVSKAAPPSGQSADVVIGQAFDAQDAPLFESTNAGIATSTSDITWTRIPTGDGWRGVNKDQGFVAIAVGGSDNPSVVYAGSGKQVFLRTEANGTLTATPMQPGGIGPIEYIAMDPANWRTAYVTDGSQVFQTDDAGTTWTSITGNLINIAGAIKAPNSGDSSFSNIHLLQVVDGLGVKVVLAGGTDGVFRMFTDTPGVWTRYGTGFPNAGIWGLQYSLRDQLLLAATYGRSAFEVQKPGATLFTPGAMEISGDNDFQNENDTIKLVLDSNNPLLLDVFLNSTTPVSQVPLSCLSNIQVNGGGGDNTLIIDNSNGPITVPSVSFDGGLGSNTLTVLDANDPNPENVRIGQNRITGLGPGSIIYKNISFLQVSEGTGGNTIILSPTVKNLDELPTSSTFLGTKSLVTINGGGADTLILDDRNNANPSSWTVTGSNVSRIYSVDIGQLPVVVTSSINYSGIANLQLNAGSGGNTITLSPTRQNLDELPVTNPFFQTTGLVTVNGGRSDTLILDDQNNNSPSTWTVTGNAVTRSHSATVFGITTTVTSTIDYSGLGNLTVNGGPGGNTITVQNTAAGTNTTVNSGNGLDVVYVRGTTGPLTVNTEQGNAPGGSQGFDNVVVGSLVPNVGYVLDSIQGALTVNTVQGLGNLALYDTAATTSEQYTLTSDTITRSGMAPIHYLVSNELFFFLGNGGNNVQVTSMEPGLSTVFVGGTGNDIFRVGDAANTLNGITFYLSIQTNSPTSQIILNDQGTTAPVTYALGSFTQSGRLLGDVVRSVAGQATGEIIYAAPMKSLLLNGASGGDTFKVQSLPPPHTVVGLNGGGGTNTLDYSQYVGDIKVDLPLGTATGLTGGIRNIQNVTGSQGNDLIVGDANPNVLIGGTGRNVIIGGAGADTLDASRATSDNILIGGPTDFDTNPAALDAIFAEWTRTDLGFRDRFSDFTTGANGKGVPPLNQVNGKLILLTSSTVQADSSPDSLIGSNKIDPATGNRVHNWFFFDDDDTLVNFLSSSDHKTKVR